MSLAVEVKDDASPALAKLTELLTPDRVHKLMAKAAAAATKAHFRARDKGLGGGGARDASGKFLGSGRSHYWNDAAAATTHYGDSGTAKVIVDKEGVALHFFGGTVRPVEATYLTIPARTEAKGKRAGEFEGLQFIPNKKGGARLVDEDGNVWFWLVKSVTLNADPTVLPDESAYMREIDITMSDYLAAYLDRQAAK